MATLPTREPESGARRDTAAPPTRPASERGYVPAWLPHSLRERWYRWFPTRRKARRAIFLSLLAMSAVFGALAGLTLVSVTDLPQIEDLEHYRPSTTTELLDIHGRTFGSFALEKRIVVGYQDIPPVLHDAILSIEDKSFESNAGINLFRAVGAAIVDIRSKGRRQGASTLTMQLSRNLFLSFEQTFTRKLQEVLLSIQIERHFTKEQIFTLYANQIYLGSGNYGFEAGSEHYFSKHLHDLSLAEAALLAGLPKNPNGYSPLRHPDRAIKRRNLVLSEMLKDGKITQDAYQQAVSTPLQLHIEPAPVTVAPYFVEEVRRQLEQEYGTDQVHGSGMRVYTTLDLDLQQAAEKSVLDNLADYERRHGWKGKLQNVLAQGQELDTYNHPDWVDTPQTGGYIHALVMDVNARHILVRIGKRYAEILPRDWAWTTVSAASILQRGDIVYVRVEDAPEAGTMHASLQQDSGAQSSMMAMDNSNGEVLAMVGGRDFNLSQFNRATQAQRQVGSSFKPYVYTAAVEAGAKPYDTIVDAPTSFYTPNGPYTPHNYEPNYAGTMSLVSAFAQSRNIPALKLANKVGIKKVIEVAHRFGITETIPAFLPVALGAASITLNEQVAAYAVFPNDGIRVEPHVIRRVVQSDGVPLRSNAARAKEVISVETARTMMTLLKAVPTFGTAARAGAELKHPIGGKTGTTNGFTDAWFIGFSPSVTCGTWIGYDNRQTLGDKEQGAKAALPAWINFMKVAIARTPNEQFPSGALKKQLDVTTDNSASTAPAPKKEEDSDDSEDSGDDNGPKSAAPPADAPSPDALPSDAPSDAAPADSQPSPAAAPSPRTSPAPAATTPRSGLVASPFGPYRPYTPPAGTGATATPLSTRPQTPPKTQRPATAPPQ
ncbi:penicillin-binding protein 1A [Terriglobus aquaticus]|uniref:peptidoglycan glycosyltransferase n=1 Tax=Terriglobus aquaticus TaxID=940139 RepID=A0ABW9KJ59_9BACT|nr:PBP1A family penicillin-binding protein [Terriglobus aquaticus]